MAAHRLEGPGETGGPVPRDPPDQQADAGAEDPWDIAGPDRPEKPAEAENVPDTDESGTGRRGASTGVSHTDIDQSDEPVPEEPSD
ncbi:hypothetical protein PYK79_42365 [Streptomyces sp. ID05-04B]|uniref:hypothetical protein n=1 Tax=unclassified Streptomyces TaxID=2593676 RepID=UPI000D1B9FFB|nr:MULTISPECIES: hypothetical protein [unclassified Streptomyces]AVV44281.1 hypothetical protein C6376_25390 [Streptomyces sp. P3]MDX5568637.1 hypothetical protein [Streptomyces sp. ID05-04B]